VKLGKSLRSLLENNLVRNMAVYAISEGISKAMPFLILPLVAYFLSPAEFGMVTNFNVVCQVLFAFTLLNTQTCLTVNYYKSNEREKPRLIFNILFLILILLGLSSLITILANRLIFKYTGLPFEWQLYAIIWVGFTALIYIYQEKLRLDEKAKKFGIYQFFQSFISAALTLLFVVFLKWGWHGRVDSLVLTAVIIGGYGLISLYRSKSISIQINWKLLMSIFVFGIPLLPHTLSFWLKSGLDKLFITNSVSVAENGIFSFAGTLASVFYLFINAFFSAYSPYLFKNLTLIDDMTDIEQIKEIKIKLLNQVRYFLLFYLFINVIGYFAFRIIIELFFKVSYGESISYLPWLLTGSFVTVFYAVFSSFVFYMKSTKILGMITLSTAILQALINYFAVIKFGVMGIIFTSILINILMAVLVGIHSQRVYPMPWRYLFKFW
jgi:O-antigen/teichoic acid export membrane protein